MQYSNIIPLQEVANMSNSDLSSTFIRPAVYGHLGCDWSDAPLMITLKDIQSEDTDINVGRPEEHSTLEGQQLADSYAKGLNVWENSLPIVTPNTEPNAKFKYDLKAGFGTIQALLANGVKKFPFWVVTGTKEQLLRVSSLENTKDLLTVSFPTGEAGIVHHFKVLLSLGVKLDTEEKIDYKLQETWPGLNAVVKGRVKAEIIKLVKDGVKPRKYRTFAKVKVDQWLSQSADMVAQFRHGGQYDPNRDRIGYCTKNALDPFINAVKKYNETGHRSYVVFHVNAPSINSSLKDKRQALLDQLTSYEDSFHAMGMQFFPLDVLGFMAQDTENEDMRKLVDVDGNPIETIVFRDVRKSMQSKANWPADYRFGDIITPYVDANGIVQHEVRVGIPVDSRSV